MCREFSCVEAKNIHAAIDRNSVREKNAVKWTTVKDEDLNNI